MEKNGEIISFTRQRTKNETESLKSKKKKKRTVNKPL